MVKTVIAAPLLFLAALAPAQQLVYELETKGVVGLAAGRNSRFSQPNQKITTRLELKVEDRQSPPNVATAHSLAEVGIGGIRVTQNLAALGLTRPMTAATTASATTTPANQVYRGTVRATTRVAGNLEVVYRARQSVANTQVSGRLVTATGTVPFVVDSRWHVARLPATAGPTGWFYDLECGQRAGHEGAFDWEILVAFKPDNRCSVRSDRSSCPIGGFFYGDAIPLPPSRSILTLNLRGALPNSSALLIASASRQVIPWPGGCILLGQPVALELASTDARGNLRRQFVVPATARGQAYLQAIVRNPILGSLLLPSNTLRLDCR